MLDTFWLNFFRKEAAEKTLQDILREIPVFNGLNAKELKEIEKIIHRRQFQKGEPVFREHEAAIGMYIITEGQVQITVQGKLNDESIPLATLDIADFFGEISLFDESPRSASATAIEPTVLYALLRPDLFAYIERKPGTGIKLISNLVKIIGERLRRTNQELKTLQLHD